MKKIKKYLSAGLAGFMILSSIPAPNLEACAQTLTHAISKTLSEVEQRYATPGDAQSENQLEAPATDSNAILGIVAEEGDFLLEATTDSVKYGTQMVLRAHIGNSEIFKNTTSRDAILTTFLVNENGFEKLTSQHIDRYTYQTSINIPGNLYGDVGEKTVYATVEFEDSDLDPFTSSTCTFQVTPAQLNITPTAKISCNLMEEKEYSVALSELQKIENLPSPIKNMTCNPELLSEEVKSLFKELPSYKEGMIQFTTAKVTEGQAITVPVTFELESPNYDKLQGTLNLTFVLKLQHRTEAQIKSMYKTLSYNLSRSVNYDETPTLSPYSAGKVKDIHLEEGLNALNFVRFIAGLPSDVTLNDDYTDMAQKGAVLLAKNGSLNHYPKKPSDMDDDFYQAAYAGTSKSNLGMGYTNIANSIINGYMNDGDTSNIDRVGHRRWILNPSMKETGFGYFNRYTALYAIDGSREYIDVDAVYWPAQVMPYEIFKGPFSVSLSSSAYTVNEEDDISVSIHSKKSDTTVVLDSSSNNGYFNINNGGYGMKQCIIFKPNRSYTSNDLLTIKISGLRDANDEITTLEYTVQFFSLGSNVPDDNGDSDNGGSGGGGSGGGSGGSSGGGGGSGSGSGFGGSGGNSGSGPGFTGTTGGAPILNSGNADQNVLGTWIQDQIGWWFSKATGGYPTSQWLMINNRWYWFNSAGYMVTGWQLIDSKWYYFNPDGAMATGWVKSGDKWYYLDTTGAMLLNTVTPDGNYVDASGVWVQ